MIYIIIKLKKRTKNARKSKEQNYNNKIFRNPAEKNQEKIEEYYIKLFNNNIAQNFILLFKSFI